MDDALREMATAVVDHALRQPPLLGGGRLVCIDGLAGSGKSTLAAAVAAAGARAGLVHVLRSDDLLDGWGGLTSIGPRLRNYVVGPLASGHPARYRRYDWEADAFAEEHVVAPHLDLLVIDGVGSGHPGLRSRRATLVWVEADDELRLARAVARDGERWRTHLEAWVELEDRLGWARVRRWADLVVDDSGRLVAGQP